MIAPPERPFDDRFSVAEGVFSVAEGVFIVDGQCFQKKASGQRKKVIHKEYVFCG
jgi:hypothetical protein